ncbi:hypothetical protein GBAR_LOCUS7517, partial [Geodia barretti]
AYVRRSLRIIACIKRKATVAALHFCGRTERGQKLKNSKVAPFPTLVRGLLFDFFHPTGTRKSIRTSSYQWMRLPETQVHPSCS